MANEFKLSTQFRVEKGGINYPRTSSVIDDVTGTKGPVPGAIDVTAAGVDIDFSELTTPGWCMLYNIGDYEIDIGIWDGTEFYPMISVKSGQGYAIHISPQMGISEDTDTGTGTYDTGTYNMRAKSVGGASVLSVEAFEA